MYTHVIWGGYFLVFDLQELHKARDALHDQQDMAEEACLVEAKPCLQDVPRVYASGFW